jgi:hypothetical protein
MAPHDAQPADPAAATTRPASVDQLIGQLSSPDWAVREDAQTRLVAMGQDAEPQLQQLLAQPPSLEVASRAEAALRQIAENRQGGPSIIQMRFVEAHPKQVFDELFRQARVTPELQPPDLWNAQSWPTISLDVLNQPFWAVMKDLTARTGVRLRSAGRDNRPVLVFGDDDDDWTDAPVSISGPFLIAATRITEIKQMALARPGPGRSNLAVELIVEVEPKLNLLARGGRPRVIEALDEQGRSMQLQVRSDEDDFDLISDRSRQWRFGVSLFRPGGDSQRIAVLRVATSAVVGVQHESVVIADPLQARNVVRQSAGQELTLREIQVNRPGRGRRGDDQGAQYVVSVSVTRLNNNNGQARLPWSRGAPTLRLLDAAGRALTLDDVESRSRDEDEARGNIQYTMTYTQEAGARGQPGQPAQLIWEVPVQTRQIQIVGEFRDLPLP